MEQYLSLQTVHQFLLRKKETVMRLRKKGAENMIEKKTWKEFRDSGLLWFVNTILH